jgi:seryl-tRNA synthetase
MHDIKWIRTNAEQFDNGLKKRGLEPCSKIILELDEEIRSSLTKLQDLQNQKNIIAKKIGSIQDKKSAEFQEALAEAAKIKQAIQEAEDTAAKETKLNDLLISLPNLVRPEVPDGMTEDANLEVRRVGDIPKFDFPVKQHFEIGEDLGLLDFEQTAKFAGARFATLKGDLSKLNRALADFMINCHTSNYGYTEYDVPMLVRDKAMFGTGQLPKMAEESFETTNNYRLIPTAEVSLANLVSDRILNEADLPMRLTAFSSCFRSEAGSAGKDTRGMIRMHQFSKVELVSVVKPEDSEAELERITEAAEAILKALKLPYRVVLKCVGDTGFTANKSYDLEVWLPGQNCYREISSCSNTDAFQARRMKARYRKSEKENEFVHTLNGSGLAVGRTIVAILENYQQKDGSVIIPEVLRPYMNNREKIERSGNF